MSNAKTPKASMASKSKGKETKSIRSWGRGLSWRRLLPTYSVVLSAFGDTFGLQLGILPCVSSGDGAAFQYSSGLEAARSFRARSDVEARPVQYHT
eukprot:1040810-Amphidinium_carterae.1